MYKNCLLLFKYNPNSKQLRSKSLKSLLPTCDQLFDRIPDIPEVRNVWFKITQSKEKNITGVAKSPKKGEGWIIWIIILLIINSTQKIVDNSKTFLLMLCKDKNFYLTFTLTSFINFGLLKVITWTIVQKINWKKGQRVLLKYELCSYDLG